MVPKLSLEDHIKKLNSKSKSKTERISKICSIRTSRKNDNS